MVEEKKANGGDPQDITAEPLGASFKFGAARKVAKEQLSKLIERVPEVEVAEVKDSIVLIKVDSRDIDGVPYLFTLIYLNPDSIEVMYTVTPEISMRKRRLELLRYVANIITLLSDAYTIDMPSFIQLLDIFLEDIKEFATLDYEKLYTKYDALLSRVEEMKRSIERLNESNEKISKDMIELRDERNELKLRVEELEKYSDDALMLKIQDWIREHDNTIDVSEFCRLYKVRESRVEEILNRMVREGFLEMQR